MMDKTKDDKFLKKRAILILQKNFGILRHEVSVAAQSTSSHAKEL